MVTKAGWSHYIMPRTCRQKGKALKMITVFIWT